MKPGTYRRCNPEVRIVSLAPSHPFYEYLKDLHNRISCRAYEGFEAEGRVHGHDVEHWLHAEAELLVPLQTNLQEIDNWIFIGAQPPNVSASELRIYAEPLRIFIAGKTKKTDKHDANGVTGKEVLTSVELPAPINLTGSFAELRDGLLTIGLPKAGKQVDRVDDGRGEKLAWAHKQHLHADRMQALSHAAKQYAEAAREHLGRASRKQEQAREFLATHTADQSKALPSIPPAIKWTEETPHSAVD